MAKLSLALPCSRFSGAREWGGVEAAGGHSGLPINLIIVHSRNEAIELAQPLLLHPKLHMAPEVESTGKERLALANFVISFAVVEP